jgi:hypothetical protein
MTFKVMDRRCDQCLYGPNKIVSDARRKQILREIEQKDCNFICHKSSILNEEVCCRGDWDARHGGQMGRIAGRLNAIELVSVDEYEARVKALHSHKDIEA